MTKLKILPFEIHVCKWYVLKLIVSSPTEISDGFSQSVMSEICMFYKCIVHKYMLN